MRALPANAGGWSNAAGLILAAALVLALATASIFIGVADMSLGALVGDGEGGGALQLLLVSRIPRTLAIILSGMSMGVAAVIMQMLFRNRFVEPTTSGTVEAASLGLLATALLAPAMPIFSKMLVAALFALAATFLFLRFVARMPSSASLLVPLLGLMFGGVINAITTFLAYRYDLLQSLAAWTNGDFSSVLRGRYELLWIAGLLAALAYLAADRFTVAGLGEAFTRNLGLNYGRILAFGLSIVSLVAATAVVTSGAVPFFGLIVANVVRMMVGDNLRRALPWVALSGAAFLLACDIAGRTLRFPYEIPVGTVVGVLGSAIFLYLLLRRRARLG
ncbi:ABC transporter permease [Nitratireductor pacificus]|uniref:Ferric anguibactin transport system permease protein FATD n=1 Tax=Nitratireductor pacificus pht-3B TaxID=391937 RepID=K2LL16_9HYPH|nr:iron chelate uptake ABC transporter family permease subunit [Nitratireductor pacificus]EKF18469.1 ferric anguibactin transport system permease protein FATD [Nitratireductor pacificus pht-3B]